MPNQAISQLPVVSNAAATDLTYLSVDNGDTTYSSKSITTANLLKDYKRVNTTVTIVNASYNVLDADKLIIASNAVGMVIYLPSATGSGRELVISSNGAGTITIEGNALDLISGEGNQNLYQYETLQLVDFSNEEWIAI